jgi:chorismate mutase
MEKKGVWLRGLRGAVQVERNERECILQAVRELFTKVVSENQLRKEDVVSILFTATPDIYAEFPACILRELGWKYIPVLCTQEMDVRNAMKMVIRVLVHAYSSKRHQEIKHQYLGSAIQLRPDLAGE